MCLSRVFQEKEAAQRGYGTREGGKENSSRENDS
jgi:hypothetical protein